MSGPRSAQLLSTELRYSGAGRLEVRGVVVGRLRAAGYQRPFTELEDGVGQYLDVLDERGGYR